MTVFATANTRQKILDAAERLFIEKGFAATSVRAIAAEAGVNLAASNYHFGSKKDLLATVFRRRVQPINEQRLMLLQELKESERPLTVRSILKAFFSPLIHGIPDGSRIPALIGRIYGEPAALTKPIMEETFREVVQHYRAALAEVLPWVSRDELHWRFHFMIGAMIHLLQFPAPLGAAPEHDTFTEGMQSLLVFVEAGLTQVDKGKLYD